ncbi:MAG: NAD(P)H-hydrate epimerase [bacterium]
MLAIRLYQQTDCHYSAAEFLKADELMSKIYGVSVQQLMEVAGLRLAEFVKELVTAKGKIVVVCAKGNNAGDGLVAARYLSHWGLEVQIVLCSDESELTSLPLQHLASARAFGIEVLAYDQGLFSALTKEDVLIDALFGCGLQRAPEGIYAQAIVAMNNAEAAIVAVDVPSGLDASTGQCYQPMVQADFTLSFAAAKQAFLTVPLPQLYIADIGINEDLFRESSADIYQADT